MMPKATGAPRSFSSRPTAAQSFTWHPHVGEVGHTAVFGWTSSGKTTFLAFLQCALLRTLSATDTMIVFDKDQGMQVAVMANGGSYVCPAPRPCQRVCAAADL